MVASSQSSRTASLANRCRRILAAADRGWKATTLGVAIVVGASLVL